MHAWLGEAPNSHATRRRGSGCACSEERQEADALDLLGSMAVVDNLHKIFKGSESLATQ